MWMWRFSAARKARPASRLVAVLPAGHRLAVRKATRVHALAGETYVSPAASVRESGDRELRRESGVILQPECDAENLGALAGNVHGRRDPDASLRKADAAGRPGSFAGRKAMRRLLNGCSATADRIRRRSSNLLDTDGPVGCWRRKARYGFLVCAAG
jgi:hypothetical protein